ncbi:response regulator transcription factor [Bifidobacterium sp. MA2]|uniref:Response regulator transcription factor n=1 Tax=Bifidobacterium santillanense TaxID=2809028 RepID=A0ABS5UQH4_9BIFI|nr:response regulator transcription factor [Bifidobacterium santillanense]MBT1173089.1 response regulator transcription factor [Bifidobacterium santillanense]
MSSSNQIGHAPHGSMPLRIGVLDNDALALDSIVRMLEMQSRGVRRKVTVWSTTSPAYAIQECRTPSAPTDALLIDMALNGVTGPQIAAEIIKRSPGTVVIGMTSYNLDTYRGAATRAGIATLLDKAAFGPRLLRTIEKIVDARQVVNEAPSPETAVPTPASSEVKSTPIGHESSPKPLTETERTIVLLSLSPLSTKQIGARMGITADTVSSHRRNIKRKLGVDTWFEAIEYCRSLHII